MNTRLPGNLAEIFPLRFRLREEMRFFRGDASIVAETVRTGKRYSLKLWQYELLSRFDGKRTFEEAAKEIYLGRPGAFTATGLLNFYNWLYNENLVLCECESIFELILGDPGDAMDDEEAEVGGKAGLSEFAGRLLRDSRVRRALAACAVVAFSLSVIRLVQVAAPVFEPAAGRLYASFSKPARPQSAVSVAASERSAQDSSVERLSLAARAPVVKEAGKAVEEPTPPVRAPEGPAYSPVIPEAPKKEPETATSPANGDLRRIEELRVHLEECRIRRDEFYLQNDEEGYRREVHRMTNLAREIGDIENAR